MTGTGDRTSRSFLRGLRLFDSVDERTLERLAVTCRVRHLVKGQLLFSYGDPADAFYIVRSGSVHLMLDSPNGRELVINEVREGDSFGELGLLTGQPRSATAVAREPSQVLVISRPEFLALLESQPQFVRRLLDIAARRLGAASEREGALAFFDAPARLARMLLELDLEASAVGYITISQEDLGRRVGLARQTVASLLGKWRRAGWLVTGRGRIVVLDRPALRRETEGNEL